MSRQSQHRGGYQQGPGPPIGLSSADTHHAGGNDQHLPFPLAHRAERLMEPVQSPPPANRSAWSQNALTTSSSGSVGDLNNVSRFSRSTIADLRPPQPPPLPPPPPPPGPPRYAGFPASFARPPPGPPEMLHYPHRGAILPQAFGNVAYHNRPVVTPPMPSGPPRPGCGRQPRLSSDSVSGTFVQPQHMGWNSRVAGGWEMQQSFPASHVFLPRGQPAGTTPLPYPHGGRVPMQPQLLHQFPHAKTDTVPPSSLQPPRPPPPPDPDTQWLADFERRFGIKTRYRGEGEEVLRTAQKAGKSPFIWTQKNVRERLLAIVELQNELHLLVERLRDCCSPKGQESTIQGIYYFRDALDYRDSSLERRNPDTVANGTLNTLEGFEETAVADSGSAGLGMNVSSACESSSVGTTTHQLEQELRALRMKFNHLRSIFEDKDAVARFKERLFMTERKKRWRRKRLLARKAEMAIKRALLKQKNREIDKWLMEQKAQDLLKKERKAEQEEKERSRRREVSAIQKEVDGIKLLQKMVELYNVRRKRRMETGLLIVDEIGDRAAERASYLCRKVRLSLEERLRSLTYNGRNVARRKMKKKMKRTLRFRKKRGVDPGRSEDKHSPDEGTKEAADAESIEPVHDAPKFSEAAQAKSKTKRTWASLANYYNWSNEDMERLISVRWQWDKYLVSPNCNGARIPQHFIPPVPPSSPGWAKFLVPVSLPSES